MPIGRLCVGRLLLLSCSSSSLGLLYRWIFSSLGGQYFSSSVDLPSGVGSPCLLHPSVVFPGGVSHWSAFCSLCLRFLPAVPPWYWFCFWWLLPSFLSVLVLPALGGRSLSCVFLPWLLRCWLAHTLGVLVDFICFGFLVCVLLGRRFLATLGFGLAFTLVHLLRDSVESQFLRDGVLRLGRVCSVGCCFSVCFLFGQSLSTCPWSSSCSGRLSSSFFCSW